MKQNIAHRKRPGRPANTDKRRNIAEELKKVALNLFAEQGYGQVTIKDIGVAANVNTAMIYYYFSDKENLCRAAIEDSAEQVFSAFQVSIDKVEGPQEKIEKWLQTHIELMDTIRKMVRVSLDLKTLGSDASAQTSPIDRFYELEWEMLSRFLQEGIAQGVFKEVNVDEVRRMVSTFLDGAVIRTLIRPKFDLVRTVATFKKTLLVYLTGSTC